MELKTLLIDKVLANFTQPRETFDKEKIKELAESILSNGLINPISVRNWKGGRYMIVAGERRWRASKLAGLKTIPTFVKEYKNDGEWMIESLIENVQREDLLPLEKAKYLKRIMDIEKISSIEQLSKRTKIGSITITNLFEMYGMKEIVKKLNLSQTQVSETKSLGPKDREKVLEKASKEGIGNRTLRELVKVVKNSTPEVKKALLNDEINVEQAERISKLQKPEQRAKAIQEHKNIDMVDKHVERNIKNVETAKEKREFDKRLIQVKNWISSLRYSITDTHSAIEKSLKLLLVNAKLYIPLMDDEQKDKFNEQLDRLLEILERGEHIVEQIKEKTK